MVAPADPRGIVKSSAPARVDHQLDNWGFIMGGTDRKRVLLAVALIAGAVIGVLVLAFLLIRVGGNNVHSNARHGFVRSAELSGPALENVIRTEGVRSVLRLVGTDERNIDRYEEEVAVCQRMGVRHFTTKMAATRLPYRSELRELFEAMNAIAADPALQPVLIHCNAGSDRTGLVSAIWLHDYRGVPLAQAREQLAFTRFMHVDALGPASMGKFLDMYEAFGQSNARISIQQWARLHYHEEKPGREAQPWPDSAVNLR